MLNYTESSRSPGWHICAQNGPADAVSSHCRHYEPRGPVGIMSMEDYRMCDSCRHQAGDASCQMAKKSSPRFF